MKQMQWRKEPSNGGKLCFDKRPMFQENEGLIKNNPRETLEWG